MFQKTVDLLDESSIPEHDSGKRKMILQLQQTINCLQGQINETISLIRLQQHRPDAYYGTSPEVLLTAGVEYYLEARAFPTEKYEKW